MTTKGEVNPVIGCARVSAVPISARVAQREVQRVKPGLYALFHALGPNVAGVIGTAVVAEYYIILHKALLGSRPHSLALVDARHDVKLRARECLRGLPEEQRST